MAALKAKLESLEGLAEGLEQFYTEQDGAFVINVERVDGLGLANADKLERAIKQERKAKDDALKIVKQIPEGKTIEDLLDASTKISELGDLSELDSLDEKLAERTKQLQEKFDTDTARVTEKFTNDLKARDNAIAALENQLQGEIVRGAALKAIGDSGGIPELLLPVVTSSVKVFKDDDGKMVAKIIGADGTPRMSSKAGDVNDMTIAEFVNELRDNDVYARAFNGNDADGGGTSKPNGAKPGSFTISAQDAKDPTKYRAAKESADKAGKPLAITD